MRLRRLDSELVRRGIARSRGHAQELIESGRVRLDGEVVLKPARQMNPAQAVVVAQGDDEGYVSRGAHKLAGALDALGDAAPVIAGRRCLDAGASTGGFTDVLLRRGASSVVAVDVGYGQLAWKLQTDPRVHVLDRTNVRTLDPRAVAPAPQVVVGDMSFISLTLVIPALVAAAAPDADFLLMVKPQFEIGKDRLGRGGVGGAPPPPPGPGGIGGGRGPRRGRGGGGRPPAHHVETVEKVARCALAEGLAIAAVQASPLPGPSGNIEYFIHMRKGHPTPIDPGTLTDHIRDAVRRGPAGGALHG